MSRADTRADRRTPYRGDQRRAALLQALQEHLEDSSLESINIADIARAAGVTRSAFYFYFENKAAAVAALSQEVYAEIFLATEEVLLGDGPPEQRIETTIRAVFDTWERHESLCRAMLEARATSAAVRTMWDSDRESFVEPVARMIAAERSAGRAPDGPDATVLAGVLLELNDRMLERLPAGDSHEREQRVDAAVTIWLRSIYGQVQRPPSRRLPLPALPLRPASRRTPS